MIIIAVLKNINMENETSNKILSFFFGENVLQSVLFNDAVSCCGQVPSVMDELN